MITHQNISRLRTRINQIVNSTTNRIKIIQLTTTHLIIKQNITQNLTPRWFFVNQPTKQLIHHVFLTLSLQQLRGLLNLIKLQFQRRINLLNQLCIDIIQILIMLEIQLVLVRIRQLLKNLIWNETTTTCTWTLNYNHASWLLRLLNELNCCINQTLLLIKSLLLYFWLDALFFRKAISIQNLLLSELNWLIVEKESFWMRGRCKHDITPWRQHCYLNYIVLPISNCSDVNVFKHYLNLIIIHLRHKGINVGINH